MLALGSPRQLAKRSLDQGSETFQSFTPAPEQRMRRVQLKSIMNIKRQEFSNLMLTQKELLKKLLLQNDRYNSLE
jgi:hypothetical protein